MIVIVFLGSLFLRRVSGAMIVIIFLGCFFLRRVSGDYPSCLSSSYKSLSKDWCFNIQRNLTIGGGWLSWDQNPDQLCYPYGRMAVAPNGIQSQLIKTYMAGAYAATSSTVYSLWVGLYQLDNQSAPTVGWNWRILHPEGYQLNYPAVMSQIPWDASANEPNDWNNTGSETNWQNYGMVYNKKGFWDTGHDGNYNVQTNQGAICQYTNPRSVFRRYGNVRVNDTRFLVQKFTPPNPRTASNICSMTCRQSGFCMSFSFNSAISDCQINAIDPSSSNYTSYFITDNNYAAYTRGTS